MTYDEKIRYLQRIVTLDAHIDALIKEKEKWYNRVLKLKSNEIGEADVDSSAAIEKVIMLENEIEQNIDRLVDMRNRFVSAVEKLDNELCREIMHLRYINDMSFEKIGDKIGYSSKQISRLHKKAVGEIVL